MRRRIALPPGMSPGAVIGKGGSNIKRLQATTGARVVVLEGAVELSGASTQVEAARQMLERQIGTFQASGGAYPHPLLVTYLLSAAFGNSKSAEAVFQSRRGDPGHRPARADVFPRARQRWP